MYSLLIFAVWDVAYYQKMDVPSFDIASLLLLESLVSLKGLSHEMDLAFDDMFHEL
jgi:hypothetical protein